MRRTRLKTGNSRLKTGNRTPLTEAVIPLRHNGQRDWSSFTDEKLIEHAKRFSKENGVSGRYELYMADLGLYIVLTKRGLLGKIGIEEKSRVWREMKDEEIITLARGFMNENGINGRKELKKADQGLYRILRMRRLLDKIGFEEKQRKSRFWKKMKDDEIIELARKFMKENGINGRNELQKADQRIYQALRKRGLLGRVGFEEKGPKQRSWKKMQDREILELARRFMEENGIGGRNELEKADNGLYSVLERRRLLDKIEFEDKLRKSRPWKKMKDDEIIELARKCMKENKISKRKELSETDPGLYNILRKRELLDKVELKKKRSTRHWKELSDKSVIWMAKRLIKEKGITKRKELEKADKGLYHVLTNRGLLDKLIFEERKKIRKRRPWKKMKDEEIIETAKTFIKENGINGKVKFGKADPGLYRVLMRRKLLDQVFSDIGQLKQQENERNRLLALSQAAEAMEQFGERG